MQNYISHPLFTEEIYQYFDIHFQNHKDFLNLIISKGYIINDFYFREILSGEFPIISLNNQKNNTEDLQKLLFSINDTKSELIPVLIIRKNNDTSRKSIHIELHSENNAF